MIAYLVLPVLVLACLLLAYVLAQDTKAVPNRLFVLYMAVVALQNIASVTRLTTVNEGLAWLMGTALGPLIAIDQWLLIWLVLALFLPQRYAQPQVRWVIALPYLIALVATIVDVVAPQGLWFGGVRATAQGTYTLVLSAQFGPLLASLIVAQFIPIVMLIAIIARHPERRAPATILLAGCLITVAISSTPQTQTVPVLYNLGPVPVYLAFAWVTLRYQLFRPTPVALQVALDALPDGVLFLDATGQIRYANRAAHRLLGLAQENDVSSLERALTQSGYDGSLLADVPMGQRQRLVHAGGELVIETTEAELPMERVTRRLLVLRDVTRDEQREAELRAQNTAQGRLLELVSALETPAIGVANGVLLSPIVGHLDQRRAQELTTRLLQTVSAQRTQRVILDLSGARAVDVGVAQAIGQTTQALRLLGCAVTVTGISADAATIMSTVGESFAGVTIARSPEEALAH